MTNKSRDTWFVGFSPDLAVGVYVGFDQPNHSARGKPDHPSLLRLKNFMEAALSNTPAVPFRVPPGLELVLQRSRTGKPVRDRKRGTSGSVYRVPCQQGKHKSLMERVPVPSRGSHA